MGPLTVARPVMRPPIIAADRDWNEGAARAQLLTVFEAAGGASDLARQGRRRLSAILFS